jgi:hypothetical protein
VDMYIRVSIAVVSTHTHTHTYIYIGGIRAMVFNTTFNNISVISWLSVLLVEETGVPGKKTTDLSQVDFVVCYYPREP